MLTQLMQTVLYSTLLALATAGWGYAFYRQDYHPQPLKVMIQAMILGALAMVPIFGYKWLYKNEFSFLAEYELITPLLNLSIIKGLVAFAANMAVLSLLLFVLSALVSLFGGLFKNPVTGNIRRAVREEPLGFVAVSLMIGLTVYLQSIGEKWLSMPIIATTLGAILFLTIIEEYVKHLLVRFVDDDRLKDIDDAITLSLMVGLAFSAVETIFYTIAVGEPGIIFYRTLISMPVHLVASGIFGYYYGLAHFSGDIANKVQEDSLTKWIQKALTLKKKVAYKEAKIVEGIFWATCFHAANNILFELNLAFLAVPLIVFGIIKLSQLYDTSYKMRVWITEKT